MKSILDKIELSVVMVDTSINSIYDIFRDYTAPLFRQFSAMISVEPLDLESSMELVEKILYEKGLKLKRDAIALIAEYSGGVPQYIKMITDLIYSTMSKSEPEEIIFQDLKSGILNVYFRALFDKFSSSEQEVLLILSRGYRRFSEIVDKAVNAAMALDMLEKKDMIRRVKKNRKNVYYLIRDKLFATWLSLQEFPRLKKLSISRAKIYYMGSEALIREIFLTLEETVDIEDETGKKLLFN